MTETPNKLSGTIRRRSSERGAILVLALLMMFIGTVLALSLMFVTESEMKISNTFDDHQKALMAAEAGVQEVLWRIRLTNDATQPPLTGSQVTGRGLDADNAFINPDRFGTVIALKSIGAGKKVKADGLNPDGGEVDEVDELDYWRDWEVRIVYDYTYSKSDQSDSQDSDEHLQLDDSPVDATLRGDRLVVPAVYSPTELAPSSTQNIAGRLMYTITKAVFDDTSTTPAGHYNDDVLRVRFLKEKDLGLGDIDGDSNDEELVYYNEYIKRDLLDNDNSISGRADTVKDNESPFNLDYNGAVDKASGYPVIVIDSTGRVERGVNSDGTPRTVAKRKIQVMFSYDDTSYASAAICAQGDLEISGNAEFHSYNSLGCVSTINNTSPWVTHRFGWDGGNCLAADRALDDPKQADIAVNGVLTLKGNAAEYHGGVKGLLGVIFVNDGAVEPVSARSAVEVTGCDTSKTVCVVDPDMAPPCLIVDIDAKVDAYATVNDNATGLLPAPDRYWTQDLSGAPASQPVCDTNTATIADPASPGMNSGVWWMKAGGHYYFDDFTVGSSATSPARVISSQNPPDTNCYFPQTERVDPDFPTNIYVKDTFTMGKNYKVFEYLRPSEYVIWHAGTTSISFGSNEQAAVSLYSPNSDVDFAGGPEIQGFMVVNEGSQKLNGNPAFYYDRTARNAFSTVRKPRVISWRELE